MENTKGIWVADSQITQGPSTVDHRVHIVCAERWQTFAVVLVAEHDSAKIGRSQEHAAFPALDKDWLIVDCDRWW